MRVLDVRFPHGSHDGFGRCEIGGRTDDRLTVHLPDLDAIRSIGPDESNAGLQENELQTLAELAATDPRPLAPDTVSATVHDAIGQGDPQIVALAAIITRQCSDVQDDAPEVLGSQRYKIETLVNFLYRTTVPESRHISRERTHRKGAERPSNERVSHHPPRRT